MRYIIRYTTALLAFFMLTLSTPSLALDIQDANIPVSLKNAYYGRFKTPYECIDHTELYIKKKQGLDLNSGLVSSNIDTLKLDNIIPVQLLAFCYAQVEDYHQTYLLLDHLLKTLDYSVEQLRTLSQLAAEIPEDQRPAYSNQFLIQTFTTGLRKMEQVPLADAGNLEANLLLAISALSLQSDQYRSANIALSAAKEALNKKPNYRLTGWLTYSYGIYYAKINQQRLAISNLFAANKIAEKNHLIKLSGETKKSIAELYQQKHLFNRAIDYAKKRVTLYMQTENAIKQADSLIQLAILKEKNNDKNQSLVYLFNALELIQNKKHSNILAHIYLELGRTYSSYVISKDYQKERLLAQKYLQNARYHFRRLDDARHQIESLLLLAKLNIGNDDPALAILQLEKTLQLSQKNYPELRVQAFNMLASSYELTGNHQQAIVHFKNFHALQNSIKERLFKLQQLQISEQLQLIEQTQHQRQLEVENQDLKVDNMRFRTLTYGAVILLIISLISIFNVLMRNRKLSEKEEAAQHKLNYHSRTKLLSQQAQGIDFDYVYQDKPLYYALVNIPFLMQPNAFLGLFSSAQLEEKLGQALQQYFVNKADIFQIRDTQILFISEQQHYQHAQEFAEKIDLFFTQFTQQHNLTNQISIGIVAFPFLNNVRRAITPTRMLNLTSLALFGANQLLEDYQQNSWLELVAIDNLQPAFFDGDLWILGQIAIQKGIVKINSSQQKHVFYWPELDK